MIAERKNNMKITNIVSTENTPKCAYDPYGLTTFGTIEFRVKGRKILIKTQNGIACTIENRSEELELRGASRDTVSDFAQQIKNLRSADIELPREVRLMLV